MLCTVGIYSKILQSDIGAVLNVNSARCSTCVYAGNRYSMSVAIKNNTFRYSDGALIVNETGSTDANVLQQGDRLGSAALGRVDSILEVGVRCTINRGNGIVRNFDVAITIKRITVFKVRSKRRSVSEFAAGYLYVRSYTRIACNHYISVKSASLNVKGNLPVRGVLHLVSINRVRTSRRNTYSCRTRYSAASGIIIGVASITDDYAGHRDAISATPITCCVLIIFSCISSSA